MELKNKIVVITGASRGLGRALSSELIEMGAQVVISSKEKQELARAAREMGAAACAGDVTREADMKRLAEFTIKKFGRIDLWINNAGLGIPTHPSIEETDSGAAHRVMEVNFFGTFYGCRAALAAMNNARRGAIMNILSSRARRASPRSAVYSASKWAARGFTEALREAVAPRGIRVFAVYPAGMKTEFFKDHTPADYATYMTPAYVAKKIVKNLRRETPREEFVIGS